MSECQAVTQLYIVHRYSAAALGIVSLFVYRAGVVVGAIKLPPAEAVAGAAVRSCFHPRGIDHLAAG